MISQEMFKISILDTSLKITDVRFQPHLPGANELTFYIQNKLSSDAGQHPYKNTSAPNTDHHFKDSYS